MPSSSTTQSDLPIGFIHCVERLTHTKLDQAIRVAGGGNNRVYQVKLKDGRFMAAKCYPRTPEDPRDRLGTEYGAVRFMVGLGLGSLIPTALGADPEGFYQNDDSIVSDGQTVKKLTCKKNIGIALYEWIDGTPIGAAGSRQESDIEALLNLLRSLHMHRNKKEAAAQPAASEACFSGLDLMTRLTQRRETFADTHHCDLRLFLETQLDPLLTQAHTRAQNIYVHFGMNFIEPLTLTQCTLSPADIGFHNALRRPEGGVTFLDFEYFGWDDPVKLTADIMLHPGSALDATERRRLADGVGALYGQDPSFGLRLTALLPLFHLRWCLIFLNEFLPTGWKRRSFAQNSDLNQTEILACQLEKAQHMLNAAQEALTAPMLRNPFPVVPYF